jgi:hypothetical protein
MYSLKLRRNKKYRVIKAPIAEECLEMNNELLLMLGEAAPFNPRPEIICPPQPAALAAPHQTYIYN